MATHVPCTWVPGASFARASIAANTRPLRSARHHLGPPIGSVAGSGFWANRGLDDVTPGAQVSKDERNHQGQGRMDTVKMACRKSRSASAGCPETAWELSDSRCCLCPNSAVTRGSTVLFAGHCQSTKAKSSLGRASNGCVRSHRCLFGSPTSLRFGSFFATNLRAPPS